MDSENQKQTSSGREPEVRCTALVGAAASNREKINIRCCECGKELTVDREPDDPPEAVMMEDLCDECGSGGFSDPVYYDADGNEIDRWR